MSGSRTTHTDASARRVALASDAFHAHLDACDRCRTHPFNLCAFGEKLLLAFGDAEARLRCKCDACGLLVDEWIGVVCIPCHDKAATASLRDAALPFATAGYDEGHYADGRRLKASFRPGDVERLVREVKPYG